MTKEILILAGDGIGPEVMQQALSVLYWVNDHFSLNLTVNEQIFGGASIDQYGTGLTNDVLSDAKSSESILLGAVGGPKWDLLSPAERPEKSGLLKLRAELDLFANLRPAILYPQLASSSSLKSELVAGLDILIVRELTGGIYFGQPRGIEIDEEGQRYAFNTDIYKESEIARIAEVAFDLAGKRSGRVCSVDKANVLEVTMLWREIMEEKVKLYPRIELSHMYVDNAAMQLIREPKQFDVIVTGNLFGDILSDAAAMLTGSIGMLPSASLNSLNCGVYEPCHGSAPDIAGKDIANPLAMILSVAMMLRYSLNEPEAADFIKKAVNAALDEGYRTADIYSQGMEKVTCSQMGKAVLDQLTKI